MSRDPFPIFRRAQRGRGHHYRDVRSVPSPQSGFGLTVAVASLATFAAIAFGDRLPAAVVSFLTATRELERDHAPPVGAYYSGCNAARAAGVAPIYSDEPSYRIEMDGDGDGIVCEPVR